MFNFHKTLKKDPQRVTDTAHLRNGLSRYQWTNENNIMLAKQGAQFIREIETELAVLAEETPQIDFTPQVYIFFEKKVKIQKMYILKFRTDEKFLNFIKFSKKKLV